MKNLWTLLAVWMCLSCSAEIRTWKSVTGETLEGEYVSIVMDNVFIQKEDGKQIKVPLKGLSEEDRIYVELQNPPKLKVEYRKSQDSQQYTPLQWYGNDGFVGPVRPITITESQFGAEVKQLSTGDYKYDLVIEMYVFTQQRLDIRKYHLIAKFKSEPFRLTKGNGRNFEYESDTVHKILKFDHLDILPRGEKLGEYLVLVRDERGEVVGYNGTRKWQINNLEKLEKLPVGAWLNEDCTRVHPTSPPQVTLEDTGW